MRAYCQNVPGVHPNETPARITEFYILSRYSQDWHFADLHETSLPAKLSLRCDTGTVEAWHSRYPSIQIPDLSVYRPEQVWCQILLDNTIPPEALLEMIDTAYQYYFNRLDTHNQQFIREFMLRQPPDEVLIRRLIAFEGLAHHSDEIIALLKPAIRIRATPVSQYGAYKRGSSKFGGWPDFPPKMPYPEYENRPMVFLAQLNLGELPPNHPSRHLLPKTGMLYFFGHMEQPDNGYIEHGRVIYYDGDLRQLYPAIPKKSAFSFTQEATLDFLNELTLPDAGSYAPDPATDSLDWPTDELEKLQEVTGSLRHIYDDLYDHMAAHQIFGYPRSIGDTVRMPEEQLLLQIDHDYYKTGFEWGDGGTVWFLLTEDRLAAGQFDTMRQAWDCG